MKKEKTITVSNVTKRHKLYTSTSDKLKDVFFRSNYGEDFYALRDVSFEAFKGEVVGFVGVNGAGKSTLSNVIAGILPETSGSVEVKGSVALIAISSGLKGNLTGRENIELKCLMLGFTKKEIEELEPQIIEFAELEKFIDQPVKSYSSGMRSRLGFAISVTIDPDIIIIDEALAVGDRAFAEKSFNKMMEFKKRGKTIIFVSHSIGQMKRFADKILWLEFGMVKDFGTVKEIIPKYDDFLNQWQKMTRKERNRYRNFSLEFDQAGLNDLMNTEGQMRIDNSHPFETRDNYMEQPTSRLGHIKAAESFIYSVPTDSTKKESSEAFKNNVYYIKREATYNNELYYLLSNRPSAVDGVIGWMKAKRVSSHSHVAIDNDPKVFYIKGTGSGFSKVWGGKQNCVFSDLKPFENCKFKVSKTEMVGNNLWYCGMLQGKQTWIHYRHLYELDR